MYEEGRRGVHFDGVESVEELDAVEFENELPQDLLTQEGSLALAVEEDNAEEAIGLPARHLRHEQLEIIDVELAVQQLLLARWILSPRYLAHVLLTAHLAAGLVLRAVLFQNQLKLTLTSLRHQLLQSDSL